MFRIYVTYKSKTGIDPEFDKMLLRVIPEKYLQGSGIGMGGAFGTDRDMDWLVDTKQQAKSYVKAVQHMNGCERVFDLKVWYEKKEA